MQHQHGHHLPHHAQIVTGTEGITPRSRPKTVRLHNGDRFDLRIQPVRAHIGDATVRMLGYNGSIPGPTLHVDEDTEVTVNVTNDGDFPTTVHWHGLRLENRYDGVPGETQLPIEVGGTFTYRVRFPDPGIYWYHPHIREDVAQEMGLYGTIIVEPRDPTYWPSVDRQLALTLDDVLIEDGQLAPFRHDGPTHVAMGRFGNVMLINGEATFSDAVRLGEVVRLYLVNTANTRIFNVAIPGARMKLVGGDSGRYEHETFMERVLLSPSERAVVDVLFETPGNVRLEHHTPDHVYELGAFTVSGSEPGDTSISFGVLRSDPDLAEEREALGRELERAPDKVLAFVASMPLLYGETVPEAAAYTCPMHPEITSAEPGTCPICGMRLVPVAPVAISYTCPMHPDVVSETPGSCPICGMKLVAAASMPDAHGHHHDAQGHGAMDHGAHERTMSVDTPSHGDTEPHHHGGSPDAPEAPHHAQHAHGSDGLEWEDLMPEINRASDTTNMQWRLIDRSTGAENAAITWAFTVGDRVKIRLVNEMDSDHPMHHPFHVHGAGRFLILSRDGTPESNLVWKDTVLIRAGETVDILLEITNPGRWMAHCHIAEHTEAGMMFSFDVAPRA